MKNNFKDVIKTSEIQKLMIIKHRYLLKIILFLCIYLFSITTILYLNKNNSSLEILLCIPFYLSAGASLHGICLFTHEGVHRTLHKNIWVNNIIGSICGYLVLQTMAGYRVLHLKHHKYLNTKGDPGLLKTYVSNKYVITAMEWGYFLFGYVAFLTVIPYQGFKQGNLYYRPIYDKGYNFSRRYLPDQNITSFLRPQQQYIENANRRESIPMDSNFQNLENLPIID